MRITLASLLAVFFLGCSVGPVAPGDLSFADECDTPGITRCDAGVPQTCHGGAWTGGALFGKCASACIHSVEKNEAFCALSSDPSPACGGGSGDRCDGGTKLTCRDGFVVDQAPCAKACVTFSSVTVFCAESKDPAAICGGGVLGDTTKRCDTDGTLVSCLHGWALERSICATGTKCVVSAGGASCSK